ncbi:hypothetical protein [Arthrobacter sp. TS-15]|nr:hypothetical protein [Arthrobacter sp. TS-15]
MKTQPSAAVARHATDECRNVLEQSNCARPAILVDGHHKDGTTP